MQAEMQGFNGYRTGGKFFFDNFFAQNVINDYSLDHAVSSVLYVQYVAGRIWKDLNVVLQGLFIHPENC